MSVVKAGLIPALRAGAVEGSESWRITSMVPGVDPTKELRVALSAETDRSTGPVAAADVDPDNRPGPPDPPVLLLVDHLEELFTLVDDHMAASFLRELTEALEAGAGRVRAVVLLPADFYDRQLLHPGFAALFTANVISALPLEAPQLEAAVSGPARRAGVHVEPTLLAELVADAAGQPGALPLFQYTSRSCSTSVRAARSRLGPTGGSAASTVRSPAVPRPSTGR